MKKGSLPRNVGILGGTFDPPHLGHLNLALEVLEKSQLDAVWFVPSLISPFKTEHTLTPFVHRVGMVNSLIKGISNLSISTIEEELSVPSYTYNTLKALQERYPETAFHLIIADEILPRFHEWKNVSLLVEQFTVLVGVRNQLELDRLPFFRGIKKKIKIDIIQTRLLGISSTEVRIRLGHKLCCRHLVYQEVLDYISKNQLYFFS